MSKRPIGAVTFDLWDCLFHDDSDEAKRAAAGRPTKAQERRQLVHDALAKEAPIDRTLVDRVYDAVDLAFRKCWHDQHVTWTVRERIEIILGGLGRTLPESALAEVVERHETMELEFRPNPAPGALEALRGHVDG